MLHLAVDFRTSLLVRIYGVDRMVYLSMCTYMVVVDASGWRLWQQIVPLSSP